MKIITTVAELQNELSGKKNIGFLPTMGALHNGHITLARRAVAENEVSVVSVFVNPTQFNDKGDLERYPRTLENDAKLLEGAGVDYVFAPSVEEVYPSGEEFTITEESLLPIISVMEGKQRPGHFDGVVQVVGRLFDIVQPQRAYFGEKDFQQLALIRAMVKADRRDLEIVGCPIVRAENGLALSSRNELLTPEQKAAAPEIYKALSELKAEIDGGNKNYQELIDNTISKINKNTYLCTEYIEIVDAKTLQAPIDGEELRICAAVYCGKIRLIDNL